MRNWENRSHRTLASDNMPGESCNEHGEHLQRFLCDNNFIASNTFFKHRACHITTWEGFIRNKKIYNQIDYILLRASRKQAMINARSHNIFTIDTDHRIVITTLYRKNDFERAKHHQPSRREGDKIITELKVKKQENRQKLSQAKTPEKVQNLRKERN